MLGWWGRLRKARSRPESGWKVDEAGKEGGGDLQNDWGGNVRKLKQSLPKACV